MDDLPPAPSGKEVKLKVAEAIQDDVNKGIVRIDSSFMRQIDIRPGNIVQITGGRATVGIADRSLPGDIGLNIIRTDPLIRRNAKTSIGELVSVRKADIKEARKVIIAPARKGIMIRANPVIFKQGLLGRAVVKGDVVALGGSRRRRTAMTDNPFFEDMFSMLDDTMMGFGLGDLKFIVADCTPKQAVLITENTEIVFNPNAVEIREEKLIDITYEDIGGLNEELKKVREMVELPLKHPEIFERLGIEPPKGVLLHGPPGTGKTLLAKAVANETNSNFILINGPEIMSKYYGQSLPGDEEILIVQNGRMRRLSIGKIVDEKLTGLQAVCFDGQGRSSIRPVTDLIKHKTQGKVLEVRTKSGRSVRVTDYHSLFTLGRNGLDSIKTSDLVPGQSYVAVPRTLPFPDKPLERVNLLEALCGEDFGLRVKNAHLYVQQAKSKLGVRKVAEILGVKEKYVYDVIGKAVKLPVSSFLRLVDAAGLAIDGKLLGLATKGKALPVTLELTQDFCTFLGLWLAEGSYTTKNEVRLSVHRKEEKDVVRLCTALFGPVLVYRKRGAQASDIYICHGALCKIMRDVLGFAGLARGKRIPEIVFNLSRECLAAFLRGYISGDGHLNLHTPAPMVEIASESPALIDDLAYLMLRFGIVGRIYSRPNRPQNRYCFANAADLEAFREIGFLTSEKNRAIYIYLETLGLGRRDRIPLTEDVREYVASVPGLSPWAKSASIGREVLERHYPALISLLEDIYLDQVISIQEVEAPEYAYDIGVEGTHNFVAGFGGIFAHNSEENLRKKFEEAEKNAPSIIFIDEIDAIASKREESRGEVERRVVAQLLAIMDGLKTRGKVVVIAATNIPNSLDPALRRPGRFDREIEIGVPSKEGRLNILKIHTRNMPVRPPFDYVAARLELEKLQASLKRAKPEDGQAKDQTEKIGRFLKKIEDARNKSIGTDNVLTDRAVVTQVGEALIKYLRVTAEKLKESDELLEVFDQVKCLDDLQDIYYGRTDLDDDKRVVLHTFLQDQGFLPLVEDRELSLDTLAEILPSVKDAKAKLRIQKMAGLTFSSDEVEEELWAELHDIASEVYDKTFSRSKERMFRAFADRTHGFVGADLAALCKESAMIVLRRILPYLRDKEHEEEAIPPELLEKIIITEPDFREALKVVSPSALREVLIEVPNVHWHDIGGLLDVKQELKEAVEWPLKHKEAFRRLGVKPPKGVLLYGPPGTGKTMLAKAVANESEANFILIKGPELLSKWVGESEKAVRKIFEKARQSSPTIVFFDEIDAIAPRRGVSSDSHVTERVVNQLLTEMDGLQELNDIVIIAATNRPDIVDTALLRPGRFDRIILVGVPDQKAREQIFKVHTHNMPLDADVNTEELLRKMENYVGADIESVCREAAILALRDDMKSRTVKHEYFLKALDKVRPSVTKEVEQMYKDLQNHFRAAKGEEMRAERPSYYG